MKKMMIALAALLSSQAYAVGYKLNCVVTYDSNIILQNSFTLKQGQRNLSFGEVQSFKFFVSSNPHHEVELQVLNVYEPSRTYATSKLTAPGTYVGMHIWKREYLLGVQCHLL